MQLKGHTKTIYQWLSTILWYLHCIEDTTVLHKAIYTCILYGTSLSKLLMMSCFFFLKSEISFKQSMAFVTSAISFKWWRLFFFDFVSFVDSSHAFFCFWNFISIMVITFLLLRFHFMASHSLSAAAPRLGGLLVMHSCGCIRDI